MLTFIFILGVMGAPDQTPIEKWLSECETDTDCANAYDALYGEGASALRDAYMRELCDPPAPGVDCEYDYYEEDK